MGPRSSRHLLSLFSLCFGSSGTSSWVRTSTLAQPVFPFFFFLLLFLVSFPVLRVLRSDGSRSIPQTSRLLPVVALSVPPLFGLRSTRGSTFDPGPDGSHVEGPLLLSPPFHSAGARFERIPDRRRAVAKSAHKAGSQDSSTSIRRATSPLSFSCTGLAYLALVFGRARTGENQNIPGPLMMSRVERCRVPPSSFPLPPRFFFPSLV